MELGEQERAILDVERSWWLEDGSKTDVIRRRLGMSASAYYRHVQALLDRPAANAYDPLVVHRLRRARSDRRRSRRDTHRAGSPPRR